MYLIKFVPDWVEVLLYDAALEGQPSHTYLYVGITFALHHATHEAVFSYESLGLLQVDPQNTLEKKDSSIYSILMQ